MNKSITAQAMLKQTERTVKGDKWKTSRGKMPGPWPGTYSRVPGIRSKAGSDRNTGKAEIRGDGLSPRFFYFQALRTPEREGDNRRITGKTWRFPTWNLSFLRETGSDVSEMPGMVSGILRSRVMACLTKI